MCELRIIEISNHAAKPDNIFSDILQTIIKLDKKRQLSIGRSSNTPSLDLEIPLTVIVNRHVILPCIVCSIEVKATGRMDQSCLGLA